LADFRDARAGPRARTAGASMWTEPLGGRWLPETVRAGARALVINLRFQQIFFPKKFFFYEFSPFEQEGTWKVCVEAGWVEDAAVRGCRGARPACAGRPAPWRRAECAALNRSLWIPGAPCNKVLQWRPVTGACRRGARGGSGNRQAGVGAWHPGRTPHARRAGCSMLVHRLRRPSAARARPGGRAVGRSTALSAGAPRVVRVCVLQFQKIQPHRVVADGAHRVVCVQKRVTGWSRRTSPSSGRSSPSVSALPVLLSLFCVSPPCASIALNASELLVMCRAEKGRGSTHEGKIPR
jgi:hypothetical protein